MLSAEVLFLVDRLNAAATKCRNETSNAEAEGELLELSQKLAAELESPWDALRRFSFQVRERAQRTFDGHSHSGPSCLSSNMIEIWRTACPESGV